MLDEQRLVFFGAGKEPFGNDFVEQRGLAAEIVLDRAGTDPGPLGDVLEGRRFVAPLAENQRGRVEDFPPSFGGAALPSGTSELVLIGH